MLGGCSRSCRVLPVAASRLRTVRDRCRQFSEAAAFAASKRATGAPRESTSSSANASATASSSSNSSSSQDRLNVDYAEIDKFSRLAATWWDPEGEMGMLHRMNPVRLKYIRDCCISHFRSRIRAGETASAAEVLARPLAGLRVIDVGCGGGLLTEPLARMGADVVGLDAADDSIQVARMHTQRDPGLASSSLTYEHATVEQLSQEGRKFDVVCALEIVEHVPDAAKFLRAVASLVDDGGGLFVSTLNKTWKSQLLAITAAEYILRWVPPGTHDWSRFLAPETVTRELTRAGLDFHSAVGVTYNPLRGQWALDTHDLDVNYALFATRRKPAAPDS